MKDSCSSRSVQWIYFISRFFSSPLEAMFTLLIFIIGKDAGATSLQIAILAASKPIVSLLAFYMSSHIVNKKHKMKMYLISMNILGCFPCFLFPFIHDPWFYVFAFALYTTATRATFPVWAEILKSHIGLDGMSRPILKGSSINYTMILVLPVLLSFWMDQNQNIWKTIFLFLALLQISSVVSLLFLKLSINNPLENMLPSSFVSLGNPLQKAYHILKENPPFFKYLIMFFLGGAGIVAMQSVLPIYFKDTLDLSYTELTLAFSFVKGISFLTTFPAWAHYANYFSLYRMNFFMNFFTCTFIVCIMASQAYIGWLFVAYMMYGAMQAGCELTWNMSGPVFSHQQESTFYSSINLAFVGIRGCVCPLLGQVIFSWYGANSVFLSAFFICLSGLLYAAWLDSKYKHLILIRRTLCPLVK